MPLFKLREDDERFGTASFVGAEHDRNYERY